VLIRKEGLIEPCQLGTRDTATGLISGKRIR
jgi:hypothetical protein